MRVSTRHGLREPWLWVLNAPAVFLVLSFSVLPIAYVGWLSLQDLRAGAPAGGWIGAANYRFVLADASTVTALRNTLYFAAASVGLATVYRTVKLLEEAGLAHSRQFGAGGHTLYEVAGARHHHPDPERPGRSRGSEG